MATSNYLKNLPLNEQINYLNKLSFENGDKLIDPFLLGAWHDNIALIPNVSWPDVINFLINKTSIFSKEKLKAYKSLEAYNYYLNGHVQQCFFNVEHSKYTVIKAKVLPSQRQSAKMMYDVWVVVDKDGSICSANCTCIAGLGSVCSHVAAMLFKLQAAAHIQINEKTPTDVLCQWNVSRKSVDPAPISKIKFSRVKLQQILPSTSQNSPKKTTKVNVLTDDMLDKLKNVNPKAVIFSLIETTNLDVSTDTASTESSANAHLLPRPLTDIFITFTPSLILTMEEQINIYNTFAKSFNKDNISFLENETRNQSTSKLWRQHRIGRITASRMHDVFHTKEICSRTILLDIMGYRKIGNSIPALKYGRQHESIAKLKYLNIFKSLHKNLKIIPQGLYIDSDNHFLGASPDGLVVCDCHEPKLLEIKCPYNYRNGLKHWQFDKNFPLDDQHKIKESNKTYTQIQGQLAVCKMESCDLFIWSADDYLVADVHRNNKFIDNLTVKLKKTFFTSILPELLYKTNSPDNLNK